MLANLPCAQSSCIAGQFAYRALFDPKNVGPTHDTVVPSSALPRKPKEVFSPARRTSIKLRFARVELGQCTECVQDVAARQFVDFDRAMPLHVWRTDFDNTRGDARSVHCNFDNIADCGYSLRSCVSTAFPSVSPIRLSLMRQGLCSVPAATAHTFWQSSPRSQWLFTCLCPLSRRQN